MPPEASPDSTSGMAGRLLTFVPKSMLGRRDVELLYFDDCPNWRVTDGHLRTLAREFGDVTVTHLLVETPDEAERVGFRGSPTVLVNGVDPFAADTDPVGGLSCRVYQTPSCPAGSPTLDQLREVFSTGE